MSNQIYFKSCQNGGIGRHARFKIWWRQLREGSSPSFGTIFLLLFFININLLAEFKLQSHYIVPSSKIYSNYLFDTDREFLLFDLKDNIKQRVSSKIIKNICKKNALEIETDRDVVIFQRDIEFTFIKDILKKRFLEQNRDINISSIEIELQANKFEESAIFDSISVSKSTLNRSKGHFVAIFKKDNRDKRYYFKFKIDAKIKQLIAKEFIPKGSILDKNNLELKISDFKSLSQRDLNNIDIFGKYRAKRNIKAGAILNKNYINLIPLIMKNQRVEATLKDGFLHIKFEAKALQNGAKGDIIEIVNENKVVFKAKIISRGKVEIL